MKTQNEILTDIYQVVVTSPINLLNGGVYKYTRPTDSELEDCVLSITFGTIRKHLQDGFIFVKIFYNDIFADNTYMQNTVNAQAKQILLYELSELFFGMPDYHFDIRSRQIYSEPVKEIHQHYAILKLSFEVTLI